MILFEPVGLDSQKYNTGMARGQYLALSKGWHSCLRKKSLDPFLFLFILL